MKPEYPRKKWREVLLPAPTGTRPRGNAAQRERGPTGTRPRGNAAQRERGPTGTRPGLVPSGAVPAERPEIAENREVFPVLRVLYCCPRYPSPEETLV